MRLKRKMGNVSNASSETEWRGALARRIGPEGRGVATIIEMVAMTRYDCMIGSSAGMRRAVSEAIDHCRQRRAFGALLWDQPIMRDVLADLAVESEAALLMTMRMARALDARGDGHEALIARLGSALGKYWICKRTPMHAYEAMECIGGSGVMEDSPLPRLYREAPVNAIWEGSGNVQCLDVLRAMQKTPDGGRSPVRRDRRGAKARTRRSTRTPRASRTISPTSTISRPMRATSATGSRSRCKAASSRATRRRRWRTPGRPAGSRARGARQYGAFPRSIDSPGDRAPRRAARVSGPTT